MIKASPDAIFYRFLQKLNVNSTGYSAQMTISDIRLRNLTMLIVEAKTTAELARITGVSAANLWQITSKRAMPSGKTRGVGSDLARKLESGMNKPSGWMDQEHFLLQDSAPAHTKSGVTIPIFDAAASMGRGYLAPEHDVVVGGLVLDESWIRQHLAGVSSPRNLSVIPAYGDSMTPTFSDGDLLLVDRGVTEIRVDAVYVLGLNSELFVKRLQRRPNQTVLMISDNKAYEPYSIANGERDQFAVLGRVVWAWNGRKL